LTDFNPDENQDNDIFGTGEIQEPNQSPTAKRMLLSDAVWKNDYILKNQKLPTAKSKVEVIENILYKVE
jgi:hypothetical protein